MGGIMDPILQDAQPVGQSMYCFSVYTENTGSTKQSHELDILQHQHKEQLGIFQCEYSDVFSDVSVQVGQGLMTKVVTDQEGDWHFAKRKVSGTWVNTGMFSQIWKQISADGKYQNADWVLKVDADAIFVPNRMRVWFKQNELVPQYPTLCRFLECDHDVLTNDLVVLACKHECVGRGVVPATWAFPHQEDLLLILIDIDDRGRQCGEIAGVGKEIREHLANLSQTLELRSLRCYVIVYSHHGGLSVIEHDLVEVLSAEGCEVVVPCCLDSAGKVAFLRWLWSLRHDNVLATDLVVFAEDECVCGSVVPATWAFPNQKDLLLILVDIDDRG